MTTLLGIIAAVLAVSLLIVVHEAGHFLAARAFGMRVERFSVGFGPVVFSLRRGGTEFALSALPLGGYVKIQGMSPGEDVDPGDRSIYANQAPWRRFATILAGPALNYLSALVLAAGLLLTAGLRSPDPAAAVGELVPGMPAEQAGLRPGDRIRAVAGAPVDSWDDLVGQLQRHPGERIALSVERGAAGERLELPITPRNEGGVGRVGFGQHSLWVTRGGVGSALGEALARTDELVWGQVTAFGKLFSHSRGTELSGPIGIAQQLVRAAREGAGAFLNLVWIISVVLAVLNLFPIPALDGGRLLFLAYELVTRRRVDARVENALHLAGFVAIVALILGVTVFGDLARLLPHLRGR